MKNLKYSSKDKRDVLTIALEERYEALRVIRERAQSVGLWALGLMVAASGWILQGNVSISQERKFVYLATLGLAFWVLRFRFLEDLERGFSSQQRVAVRIEQALGYYEVGLFDNTKEPIYPEAWKRSGDDGGNGKFFSTIYLLLYVGVLTLAGSIILSCDSRNVIYMQDLGKHRDNAHVILRRY